MDTLGEIPTINQLGGSKMDNGVENGTGFFGGLVLGDLLERGKGNNNSDQMCNQFANTNSNLFNGNYMLSSEVAGMNNSLSTQNALSTDRITSEVLSGDMGILSAVNQDAYSGAINALNTKYELGERIDSVGSVLQRELTAVQMKNQECCCTTNLNLTKMGYENQISTINAVNALAMQNKDCCCETNLNITRMGYDTQIRDLISKNDTDKQLYELKCGQDRILDRITDSEKNSRIAYLEDKVGCLASENEKAYAKNLHNSTNYRINSLGDAMKVQFGATFPWVIPGYSGL